MWEGGIDQDSATEVTHLGLNQHPVFSSGIITMYGNTKVTSAVHGCHGNPILY